MTSSSEDADVDVDATVKGRAASPSSLDEGSPYSTYEIGIWRHVHPYFVEENAVAGGSSSLPLILFQFQWREKESGIVEGKGGQ